MKYSFVLCLAASSVICIDSPLWYMPDGSKAYPESVCLYKAGNCADCLKVPGCVWANSYQSCLTSSSCARYEEKFDSCISTTSWCRMPPPSSIECFDLADCNSCASDPRCGWLVFQEQCFHKAACDIAFATTDTGAMCEFEADQCSSHTPTTQQADVSYATLDGLAVNTGNTLASPDTATLNDCFAECTSDPDCHSVKFCNEAGQARCQLKDAKLTSSSPKTISGEGCLSFYQANDDTDPVMTCFDDPYFENEHGDCRSYDADKGMNYPHCATDSVTQHCQKACRMCTEVVKSRAPSENFSSQMFMMKNEHNNLCLLATAPTKLGSDVVFADCDPANTNQLWLFNPDSQRIKSVDGLCLYAKGGHGAGEVVLSWCNAAPIYEMFQTSAENQLSGVKIELVLDTDICLASIIDGDSYEGQNLISRECSNSYLSVERWTIDVIDCPESCASSDVSTYICASNGKTQKVYKNHCQLAMQNCKIPYAQNKYKVLYVGKCLKTDCPRGLPTVKDPVCGNDQVTYDTQEALWKARCDNGFESLAITHYGPCDTGCASDSQCPADEHCSTEARGIAYCQSYSTIGYYCEDRPIAGRPCAPGLDCVDNECVQYYTPNKGCVAEAYHNTATGRCELYKGINEACNGASLCLPGLLVCFQGKCHEIPCVDDDDCNKGSGTQTQWCYKPSNSPVPECLTKRTLGQSCANEGELCLAFLTCQYGFCTGCASDGDCANNEYCDSYKGKQNCVQYAQPGESCERTICQVPHICVQNMCQRQDPCKSDKDCKYGQYCRIDMCKKYRQQGETCDSIDTCDMTKGLVCNYQNTCAQPQANGNLCQTNEECVSTHCDRDHCVECSSDAECPDSEQRCDNNKCAYWGRAGDPCNSQNDCRGSMDCKGKKGGKLCVEDACENDADCRSNIAGQCCLYQTTKANECVRCSTKGKSCLDVSCANPLVCNSQTICSDPPCDRDSDCTGKLEYCRRYDEECYTYVGLGKPCDDTRDIRCEPGYDCNRNKMCAHPNNGGGSSGGGNWNDCRDDFDCDVDRSCNGNDRCVRPFGFCNDGNDCPMWQRCEYDRCLGEEMFCQNNGPIPYNGIRVHRDTIPNKNLNSNNNYNNCPSGYECVSGRCIIRTHSARCTDDYNCNFNEKCVDKYCRDYYSQHCKKDDHCKTHCDTEVGWCKAADCENDNTCFSGYCNSKTYTCNFGCMDNRDCPYGRCETMGFSFNLVSTYATGICWYPYGIEMTCSVNCNSGTDLCDGSYGTRECFKLQTCTSSAQCSAITSDGDIDNNKRDRCSDGHCKKRCSSSYDCGSLGYCPENTKMCEYMNGCRKASDCSNTQICLDSYCAPVPKHNF